jgi:hypothetical protein
MTKLTRQDKAVIVAEYGGKHLTGPDMAIIELRYNGKTPLEIAEDIKTTLGIAYNAAKIRVLLAGRLRVPIEDFCDKVQNERLAFVKKSFGRIAALALKALEGSLKEGNVVLAERILEQAGFLEKIINPLAGPLQWERVIYGEPKQLNNGGSPALKEGPEVIPARTVKNRDEEGD